MSAVVDVRWPVVLPGRVPVQHHYPLLASLSRIVPEIHSLTQVGVHAIRGNPVMPGILELNSRSVVSLRAPADLIPKLLSLSGKKLDLAGYSVRLCVPQVFALTPAERVWSRLVTIKGYMEPEEFTTGVRRQLDYLGIAPSAEVEVGCRHVLRVKNQVIVGFSLFIANLTEADSITLQAQGLGGRRHFGCGLFLPRNVRVHS